MKLETLTLTMYMLYQATRTMKQTNTPTLNSTETRKAHRDIKYEGHVTSQYTFCCPSAALSPGVLIGGNYSRSLHSCVGAQC